MRLNIAKTLLLNLEKLKEKERKKMPLYNKNKIYTLALNRLGITETVDLSSNDVKITVLDNDYDTAVDTLLGEVDWNFAKKIKTLSFEKFQNGMYFFDVPNDCVKIREIISSESGKKLKFERIGKYVVTIEKTVEIYYTSNNLDENDFTSDFVKTLSFALASSVAYTLTESEQKMRTMNALYNDCVRKYAAINANENNECLEDLEYWEMR